ncbi:hypothetical protein TNCV_2605251 [Trichonephila clavipes]|nr:hypothetical protein TNCV_2605251 [Trichonephila clavipes]
MRPNQPHFAEVAAVSRPKCNGRPPAGRAPFVIRASPTPMYRKRNAKLEERNMVSTVNHGEEEAVLKDGASHSTIAVTRFDEMINPGGTYSLHGAPGVFFLRLSAPVREKRKQCLNRASGGEEEPE